MKKIIIIICLIVFLGCEVKAQAINKEDKALEYSENELKLLERVTMSETSIEPYECKVATAVTVLKRAKMYNKTIEAVIYEPWQYSLADNND